MSIKEKSETYIYTSDDLTLVTALLCHEGMWLEGAVVQSTPEDRLKHLVEQSRKPRVEWTVGCDEQELLSQLLEDHKRRSGGLVVGARKYEEIRARVVIPAMIEAQRTTMEEIK